MPTQERAAEEAAHYPTNHILAVINDRNEAEQAVQALRDDGFTHIELLTGADSLRKVHQKKSEENPLEKFWADAREALTEAESSEKAYRDALSIGHCVVMAGVASADDADRADDILRRYHAHTVQHFSQWTVTNLPDAPAR